VLAQQAVAETSNEITAIPDLLSLLALEGAVVSMEAMGGRKAIAQTIVEGQADDVLALKDHHPTLSADVQWWLDAEVGRERLPVLETIENDHGRIEIRRYALSSAIDGLDAKPVLGRPVDLVTEKALRPELRPSIERDAIHV